jgi:hypothetical protein
MILCVKYTNWLRHQGSMTQQCNKSDDPSSQCTFTSKTVSAGHPFHLSGFQVCLPPINDLLGRIRCLFPALTAPDSLIVLFQSCQLVWDLPVLRQTSALLHQC